MSSTRRAIYYALLLVIVTSSCNSYRESLIPNSRAQVEKNVHGSYALVRYLSGSVLDGELILLEEDTLHLLREFDLLHIPKDSIWTVRLVLTKNNTKKYAYMVGASIALPLAVAAANPDYSGSFAVFAVPAFVFGSIALVVEMSRDPHIISYPSDIATWKELAMYSRFPMGLPESVDMLSIKRVNEK